MANASGKKFGPGEQGKGTGSGAMAPEVETPESGVLSNRERQDGQGARGRDGKANQTDDLIDHAANRRGPPRP